MFDHLRDDARLVVRGYEDGVQREVRLGETRFHLTGVGLDALDVDERADDARAHLEEDEHQEQDVEDDQRPEQGGEWGEDRRESERDREGDRPAREPTPLVDATGRQLGPGAREAVGDLLHDGFPTRREHRAFDVPVGRDDELDLVADEAGLHLGLEQIRRASGHGDDQHVVALAELVPQRDPSACEHLVGVGERHELVVGGRGDEIDEP